MDNSNLTEEQRKLLRECLMMTTTLHRFLETNQPDDARGLAEEIQQRLFELNKL